ncbi:MAG: CAP domain-containing protein, partial [bacterium]
MIRIIFLLVFICLVYNHLDSQVFEFSGENVKSGTVEGCTSGAEKVVPVNIPYEYTIIELVNAERRKKELPPLKKNDQLTNSARFHAKDMGENYYFSHESRDADSNITCKTFDRLKSFYSYDAIGENIAYGYSTPSKVHKAWVGSENHYKNIINSNFREIGVGYYHKNSISLKHCWVQDFGKKNNIYPIVINDEAYQTSDTRVNLYIYGESKFDEMRIRNENNSWSNWQPFQSSIAWQLPGKDTCIVQVEMRNSSGSITSKDDIIYNGLGTETNIISCCKEKKDMKLSIYPNPGQVDNMNIYLYVPGDIYAN